MGFRRNILYKYDNLLSSSQVSKFNQKIIEHRRTTELELQIASSHQDPSAGDQEGMQIDGPEAIRHFHKSQSQLATFLLQISQQLEVIETLHLVRSDLCSPLSPSIDGF